MNFSTKCIKWANSPIGLFFELYFFGIIFFSNAFIILKKGEVMNVREYFINVNKKAKELNKKAKNVMTEPNFKYNPFMGAFTQTYAWIEKENKDIKIDYFD